MAIVDYLYYTTTYASGEASECDFPSMEARAEDIIGAMTRWAVTGDTIATFPAFIQTLVKKAICAQVDFFAFNGLDAVAGSSGVGFTVGKVSINSKSGSELVRKGAMADNISPMTLLYLEQTGLLNPQVPTLREPWIGWCLPC